MVRWNDCLTTSAGWGWWRGRLAVEAVRHHRISLSISSVCSFGFVAKTFLRRWSRANEYCARAGFVAVFFLRGVWNLRRTNTHTRAETHWDWIRCRVELVGQFLSFEAVKASATQV